MVSNWEMFRIRKAQVTIPIYLTIIFEKLITLFSKFFENLCCVRFLKLISIIFYLLDTNL